LVLDDELRELIIDKAPIRRIKDAAQARGTRSLRQSALNLVQFGGTTFAEIKRVTMHA
jgi:general secretion pathway protein E